MNALPVLERARQYRKRGWAPIPIPPRQKAPTLDGWPNIRLTEADLPQVFNGQPVNIGVLLGEASSGLVDVDLDSSETVALAPTFLPATGSQFGRRSRPASHWIYYASPLVETEKFADIDNRDDEKSMLVELRSTGAQTVFPGSIHPSGELVEWAGEGEPARVPGPDLRAAVVLLAVASLLARHWPPEGSRHQA